MNVFELYAKLGLDSSEYDAGLDKAMRAGSALGGGLATAASVGIKAVGMATTAMVGMGAASIATGQDFDKSMSQVAATMGTTVDQIDNLRNFAQEMGRTTAFSATQAADALNYMALAGYDAETSMSMLPNVLNLAAAGDMDLALASDMLTDTQTAFGISLERTNQLVDEMAKAASTGNTSVTQLGEAFLTVGGLAAELNGGIVTLEDGTEVAVDGVQELEIALTAMANAGIKGNEAGTHMRNMLLKLSSPTSDGTKALEAMGVAVFDTEGNMRSLAEIFGDLDSAMSSMTQEQKIQTISDLFNARDIASAEAMLNAVTQDWDKIGEAIVNAEGAAQAMADTQLDNLAGDVTLFKSALEGAKIAISDTLTPSLREFVKFGTDGLSRLTSAFKEGGLSGAMGVFGDLLSEGLSMVIQKLPEFIDGGIQLLEALGKGIIENLPLLTDTATQIISQLGSALAQNMPALMQAGSDILNGLLTAISDNLDTIAPIITEFIVGVVQIMTDNADQMIEIAITIMGAIGDGIVQAAPIIAEKAPEIIGALTSAIAENPAALIALGPKILGHIVGGIKTAIPLIKGAGKLLSSNLGTSITSTLSSGLSTVGSTLSSGLSSAASFATADMGAALSAGGAGAVATAGTAILGSIAAFFGGAEIGKKIGGAIFPDDEELYEGYSGISGTIDMIKDLFSAMGDFIKFAWEDASTAISGFASEAWEGISGAFEGIGGWFEEKFSNAKELASKSWSDIKDKFSEHWNNIQETFSNVGSWFEEKFSNAKEDASNAWSDIKDKFSEHWNNIKNAFENTGTWFKENFTTAKENAISAWDNIKSNFEEIWGNIKDGFKLGDVIQWGKDMIDNFINGIKQKWNDLKDTLGQTANTIKEYLGFSEPEKGPLSDFHTYAPDMIDLFTSGIEAGKQKIESTLNNVLTMPDTLAMPEVEADVKATSSTTPVLASGGTLEDITGIITNALSGIVVEVNMGTERLDDVISTSIQRTAYRSGGR